MCLRIILSIRKPFYQTRKKLIQNKNSRIFFSKYIIENMKITVSHIPVIGIDPKL